MKFGNRLFEIWIFLKNLRWFASYWSPPKVDRSRGPMAATVVAAVSAAMTDYFSSPPEEDVVRVNFNPAGDIRLRRTATDLPGINDPPQAEYR